MKHLDAISDWPDKARLAKYSSKKLAKHCTVSMRTLRRYFPDTFGKSPQDLLNELRLWDALALLCAGEPVKGTADKLGFKSEKYFDRRFKRYFGEAPSDFLRIHRKWDTQHNLQLQELYSPDAVPADLLLPPWVSAERTLFRKQK